MNLRTRSCRHLLGLLCLAALSAGCSTTPANPVGDLWTGLWGRKASDSAPAGDLKNPEGLHLAYARWREQVGDLVEARESYEAVLGETPGNAEAILGLARLDQLAGRPELAERRLTEAVRAKPGDPYIMAALGQLYASQYRWEEAIEMHSAATAAAPDQPEFRYHLAVALAQRGDFDAALAQFERSVGAAEARYNVGYLLYEQGRLTEAERLVTEAVQMRPDLEPAQSLLAELAELRRNRNPQVWDSGVAATAQPMPAPPPVAYYNPPAPMMATPQPPPPVHWPAAPPPQPVPGAGFPLAQPAPVHWPSAPSQTSPPSPPLPRGGQGGWPFPRGGQGGSSQTVWNTIPTAPPGDGLSAIQREQMLNQRLAEAPTGAVRQ
ncbi:MAG: tetratricopeptide repeat protein [Planctomycetes bacterium]|nr:tetratricopeptide repeat protein [Planctomycetota bacterium]